MELASQVGKGDGAAAAGEAWVSRRPESADSGGKLSIRATFFKKFKKCKKAFGRLSKIFHFGTENGEE